MDSYSRREREVMDIVYRLEQPTAADIRGAMASPPSYSAVRALLATLVRKGALTHEPDGPRYRYRATRPKDEAQQSALSRVVEAFFQGSAAQAAVALLRMDQALPDEEIARLEAAIAAAERDAGSTP